MAFKCQEDSFLEKYISKVLSCKPSTINTLVNGQKVKLNGYAVVLQNTILFPEGGGQPSDTGFLNDSKVYHVERKGEIAVHYVDKPLIVGEEASQVIDWAKREDHMQQHSGQHLLSAVLERDYKMTTLSWWLGEEVSYVELDVPKFDEKLLSEVEKNVNKYIKESRKVTVSLYNEDSEIKELDDTRSVKGLPEDHKGPIRVINIEGIDRNMCCGTHVTNLSQLQSIKLLHSEKSKRKGNTLLHFLVGNRVLKRLETCLKREEKMITILKSNPSEHFQLVEKLQKNVKTISKNFQVVLKDLAKLEAEKLKNSQPVPKYFCLHRKEAEADFMSIFIQELNRDDIFLFLSIGDEKGIGNIVLYGDENDVTKLGPTICEILNGKGAGKGKRYQAKVSNLSNKPKAELMIKEHFSENENSCKF